MKNSDVLELAAGRAGQQEQPQSQGPGPLPLGII